MKLSPRRRWIIGTGLTVLALLCLVPPWRDSSGWPVGYGLLFWPSAPYLGGGLHSRVDLSRLLVQVLLVALVTAALVLVFPGKATDGSSGDPPAT